MSRNTDLEEQMYELVEDIYHLEIDILNETVDVEADEKDVDRYLLRLKDEIANEEDDKGKPLYSNDMKRQAALASKLEEDYEHAEKLISIKEVRNLISRKQIDLKHKQSLLSVMKLIYRGSCNE